MYVAVMREGGRTRYELRRTVPVDGGLGFETLADLGSDPWTTTTATAETIVSVRLRCSARSWRCEI